MINDCKELVGTLFLHKGRDIKTGLDCFGLVLEVYRRNGIILADPMPDYDENWETRQNGNPILENYHLKWRRLKTCEKPDLLDIVLFGNKPSFPTHIGIVVDDDTVLHCGKGYGVVLNRLSRLGKVIHGYYCLKDK